MTAVPLGAPFGGASTEGGVVTVEGAAGYEFRHHKHFKTFVQLGVISENGKNRTLRLWQHP